MSSFKSDVFDNSTPDLEKIINNANAGIWEFNLYTKDVKWSVGFYRVLGYEPGDIECSYNNFLENILYFQDKKTFLNSINFKNGDQPQFTTVRLLTSDGYQWFQSSTRKKSGTTLTGTIINIHQYKLSELELVSKQKKYLEANKIAKVGSWEIDPASQTLILSDEVFDILELPHRFDINTETLIGYFEPRHRAIISDAIIASTQHGQPYDHDLQLRTAKNNVIWVKMKGLTIIDDFGKCTSIKGIIQNIDQNKQREAKLRTAYDLVKHQNTRLQSFAYIVSHNLRSHASNLQFMVNLHEATNQPEDRLEIFSHIKTISQSFNTTIDHLNKIVKIESEIEQERQLLNFEAVYENVKSALESNITTANAIVTHDFSNHPEVYYIPAYLESIFHNLLTNSIKYRHPDRQAVIHCHTVKKDDSSYLIFEDNGLGIDMDRYGHMLFGMYQTFHKQEDSTGVGLFITRNQIEALGGEISVESAVNAGTKFTIRLT